MKKIVFLTGAGISAESGIKTFRDSDGLWENHRVEDVASIEGWYRNPKLVIDFYNERRRQLETVKPNRAHEIIYELEKYFDVTVITQNVDNLHERAGSTNIIHLHGELTKIRPVDGDDMDAIDIGYADLSINDKDSRGVQLRPHIVWFGEAVPMIEKAVRVVSKADVLVIVGTSMVVYPAAGLIHYAPAGIPIYLIDPKPSGLHHPRLKQFVEKATTGMEKLKKELLNEQ